MFKKLLFNLPHMFIQIACIRASRKDADSSLFTRISWLENKFCHFQDAFQNFIPSAWAPRYYFTLFHPILFLIIAQCLFLLIHKNHLYVSIYVSVCTSVLLSVRSAVHPSVRPSVRLSVRPSVHPSVYLLWDFCRQEVKPHNNYNYNNNINTHKLILADIFVEIHLLRLRRYWRTTLSTIQFISSIIIIISSYTPYGTYGRGRNSTSAQEVLQIPASLP